MLTTAVQNAAENVQQEQEVIDAEMEVAEHEQKKDEKNKEEAEAEEEDVKDERRMRMKRGSGEGGGRRRTRMRKKMRRRRKLWRSSRRTYACSMQAIRFVSTAGIEAERDIPRRLAGATALQEHSSYGATANIIGS